MGYSREKFMKQLTLKAGCCFFILILLAGGAFGEEDLVLKSAASLEPIKIKVVKRIKLPKGYHEGLFYDNGSMWVSNGQKGSTWIVDLKTGKVTSKIEPISTFTEAVVRGPGGSYLATDWDDKKLYRASLEAGKLIPQSEVDFSPAHPAGLVWNGSHIFVITWTRGMGTKFHLLQLDEKGDVVRKMRIERIQEPSQMAWDGTYLWITSWYSKLVYKVDITKWEVVGSFRSPVSDATGIAWDGSYLWITGTRGDLYQVKTIGGR